MRRPSFNVYSSLLARIVLGGGQGAGGEQDVRIVGVAGKVHVALLALADAGQGFFHHRQQFILQAGILRRQI